MEQKVEVKELNKLLEQIKKERKDIFNLIENIKKNLKYFVVGEKDYSKLSKRYSVVFQLFERIKELFSAQKEIIKKFEKAFYEYMEITKADVDYFNSLIEGVDNAIGEGEVIEKFAKERGIKNLAKQDINKLYGQLKEINFQTLIGLYESKFSGKNTRQEIGRINELLKNVNNDELENAFAKHSFRTFIDNLKKAKLHKEVVLELYKGVMFVENYLEKFLEKYPEEAAKKKYGFMWQVKLKEEEETEKFNERIARTRDLLKKIEKESGKGGKLTTALSDDMKKQIKENKEKLRKLLKEILSNR